MCIGYCNNNNSIIIKIISTMKLLNNNAFYPCLKLLAGSVLTRGEKTKRQLSRTVVDSEVCVFCVHLNKEETRKNYLFENLYHSKVLTKRLTNTFEGSPFC